MIVSLDDDFSQLNQLLQTLKPSQIFILCDENTHQHCVPIVLGNLETESPLEILEIEAGEHIKNIETATQLWEILSDFKADRKSIILNIGGGVITDLGGFVAATYKRGIPFLHIPTTLLAMCDASVGGKTGIDLQHLKNIVGTFSHPESIFLYPKFLTTLPFDALRSGFAEMLKHGLIADSKHWEDLISIEKLDAQQLSQYIARSVEIKQQIVTEDFKEQNIRKTLNFGHTIGHAIESLFLEKNTPIPHGEAVALGMICETKLSTEKKLISEEISHYIITHLQKFYPYIPIDDCSNAAIIELMQNDKKNVKNETRFALLKTIGEAIFDIECTEDEIVAVLNYYRNLQN